jgi:hypothetical protein
VEGGGDEPREPTKPVQSFVETNPDAFQMDDLAELVRDERGVRIARVDEESD